MTPARFSECLLTLGWSNRAVAARLGCSELTVRLMRSGKRPVPDSVKTWLEHLARVVADNPAPGSSWLTPYGQRINHKEPATVK